MITLAGRYPRLGERLRLERGCEAAEDPGEVVKPRAKT
jgi:hypothetical protein